MMAECEVSKAQLAEAEALLTKLKASFQEVSGTLPMPAVRLPPHWWPRGAPRLAPFPLDPHWTVEALQGQCWDRP